MSVRTNVKINLGLRVLGRRQDGFHELETLFVPWHGFGDEIDLRPIDGDAPVLHLDTLGGKTGAGGGRPEAGAGEDPGARAANVLGGYAGGAEAICGGSGASGLLWPAEKDLCVRAWRALKADFNIPAVEITLRKGSPVGAGLGGGSADAAFTLKALRDMFCLPLTDADLAVYAASLGSDCPFFIWNRPMIGRGRGEILEPFDLDLSGYEIRVGVPSGVTVNTAQAYRDIDALREAGGALKRGAPCVAGAGDAIAGAGGAGSEAGGAGDGSCETVEGAGDTVEGDGDTVARTGGARAYSATEGQNTAIASEPLEAVLRRPVRQWRELLVNDFEGPVFAAHPEIAALKRRFYDQGAVYASMSGSGSAVFGLWER